MPRGQGIPAGLSAQRIAQAALQLADDEGLAALTIRGVARRLGVEPMSIYHHVAGKEALFDAVWDEIMGAAILAPDHPDPSWQGYLRQTVTGYRAALLAHPHVLPVMLNRRARTPRSLELVQQVIAGLTTRGVPLMRAVDMVDVVSMLTIAHVLTEHRSLAQPEPPALDPERHGLLLQVIMQSIELDPAAEDARRFRNALDALIHGYAAQLSGDADSDGPG